MIRNKNTLAIEIDAGDLAAIYNLASKLKLPSSFNKASYEVTQTARYLEALRKHMQEQQLELGFTITGMEKPTNDKLT